MNQNFYKYAHLHSMSSITLKFHEILLSGFRGVALTKKQDWLTDERVKNIIPSATHCVGYNNNDHFAKNSHGKLIDHVLKKPK